MLTRDEIVQICELEAPVADTIREVFRARDEITFAGGEDSTPVSDADRAAALQALGQLNDAGRLAAKV